MKKAKCSDIEVCYEIRGAGFPLVMIAGLGANMDWWEPSLVERTSEIYRTIVFDNRGAGRTSAPKIDYSIRMFADDTIELMKNLGMGKAHILGISMGGMIAQELALSYPERVEKLVLCSTNCGASRSVRPGPEVMSLLLSNTENLDERINNMFAISLMKEFVEMNPAYVKQMTERIKLAPISTEARTRQLKAVRMWDCYARLPEISARTLIMHGRKDILIPPENANILAERIPGSKLVYIENCGHLLFSQETESVNSLLGFLSSSP